MIRALGSGHGAWGVGTTLRQPGLGLRASWGGYIVSNTQHGSMQPQELAKDLISGIALPKLLSPKFRTNEETPEILNMSRRTRVPLEERAGKFISALRVCFQEGMFSGRLQSFEVL